MKVKLNVETKNLKEMNKDQARRILEEWLSNRVVILPIVDEVIFSRGSFKEGNLEDWTFKELIKIAYDLS